MSRADRRRLERTIRRSKRLAHPVPGSVTLRGGPMDGWIVKPDAPALQSDWREKYLEEKARQAYEETRLTHPDAPAWEQSGREHREHYLAIVREAHGSGRYVMLEGTRLPEARWEPA